MVLKKVIVLPKPVKIKPSSSIYPLLFVYSVFTPSLFDGECLETLVLYFAGCK